MQSEMGKGWKVGERHIKNFEGEWCQTNVIPSSNDVTQVNSVSLLVAKMMSNSPHFCTYKIS